MRDVIDAEFEPVDRPPKRRFPWFTALYTLTFYAGCIAVAASNEAPETRGAAAFGAAIFGPAMRFFSQIGQRVSEQEAQSLRWRLLGPWG